MEVRKKKINRKWSQIPENAQENLGAFKILNRWWRLTPWRKVKGTIGEIYSVRWVRYYKCKEEIYPACVIGIIGRGGAQPFHFEACDIRGDVLADGRCNTLETAALSCQEAIRKEILPK